MARKLLLFLPLLALSCVIAALFGALHNQFSFSVAPEYFTGFKFIQFAIPEDMAHRVGAAWVGVMASWWMGLVIGVPVLTLAMFDRVGAYVDHWRRSVMWTVGLSAVWALLGFGLAYVLVDANSALAARFSRYDDPVAFLRAAGMHDASYLGGGLGLIMSLTLIVRGLRQGEGEKARPADA